MATTAHTRVKLWLTPKLLQLLGSTLREREIDIERGATGDELHATVKAALVRSRVNIRKWSHTSYILVSVDLEPD